MAVYLILMAVVLLLAYPLVERKPNVTKKLCYVICTFGAMILISFCRYGLGNDYYSYIHIFRRVAEKDWLDMFNTGFEPGFVLLDKIISCFTMNVDIMFAFYALLILVPTAYVIFRHSENIWMSTMMFISLTFFYCSLSFLRQAIAVAIILLGYRYFKERNHFMVLLFIFIACLFHSTVVIMLPIYMLGVLIKPTKITVPIYAVLTAVVYFFSWDILNIAVKILPQYKNYLNLNFITQGYKPVYIILPTVIMIIALIAHFTSYGKAYPKQSALFTNFAIFNFIIWLMSLKHFVVERFSMYVYIMMIMFIPSIVTYYRKRLQVYWYQRKHTVSESKKAADYQDGGSENKEIYNQIIEELKNDGCGDLITAEGPKLDCTVHEFLSAKADVKKAEPTDNTDDDSENEEQEKIGQEEREQLLREIMEEDGEEIREHKPKKKKRRKLFDYTPDEALQPENYVYKKPKNAFLQIITHPIPVYAFFLAVSVAFSLWYNYFGLTVSSRGFHGVVPYKSIVPAYMELRIGSENEADKNKLLKKETDTLSYLYRIQENENYTVLISGKNNCVSGLNDGVRAELNRLGLTKLASALPTDKYVAVLSGGKVVYEKTSPKTIKYETTVEGFKTVLESSDKAVISMGGKDFSVNEDGLNVVVMDNRTKTIVDRIRIKGYYVMLSITR